MEDNDWLMLFLLCSLPEVKESINKEFEQIKKEKEYQQNCPNIEWWQDMNAHIPFCKIDGDVCDMQCKRKYGNNSCI